MLKVKQNYSSFEFFFELVPGIIRYFDSLYYSCHQMMLSVAAVEMLLLNKWSKKRDEIKVYWSVFL